MSNVSPSSMENALQHTRLSSYVWAAMLAVSTHLQGFKSHSSSADMGSLLSAWFGWSVDSSRLTWSCALQRRFTTVWSWLNTTGCGQGSCRAIMHRLPCCPCNSSNRCASSIHGCKTLGSSVVVSVCIHSHSARSFCPQHELHFPIVPYFCCFTYANATLICSRQTQAALLDKAALLHAAGM